MKQLIFIIALVAGSISAQAQAGSIKVTNTSLCDVFFTVLGDVNPGTCSIKYESSLIPLGPGASVFYGNPTVVSGGMNCASCTPATLAAGDYITGIRVYDNNAGCVINTYDIGEPCTGLLLSVTYPAIMGGCAVCNPAESAAYTPPTTIGGVASVVFW